MLHDAFGFLSVYMPAGSLDLTNKKFGSADFFKKR